MAAFEDWSWGTEVLLEERRQLNGSYNIYMHEDLLQAIFLQYVGVRWSVFWKNAFAAYRQTPSVWKKAQASIDPLERKRRDYYLGAVYGRQNVDSLQQKIYRNGYFLSSLLDSHTQDASAEEGDEEADFAGMACQSAGAPQKRSKQTARRMTGGTGVGGALRHRRVVYHEDDDDDGSNELKKPKNAMEAKQVYLISIPCYPRTDLLTSIIFRTCFIFYRQKLSPKPG